MLIYCMYTGILRRNIVIQFIVVIVNFILDVRAILYLIILLACRTILVEKKLLALPEHLSSYPGFCRVLVAESLVFCVVFYRSLFVLINTGFETFISGLSHNSSVFSSFYDNIAPLHFSYDTDSSYCETHDIASRYSILTHSSPPIVLNCKEIPFVFKTVI